MWVMAIGLNVLAKLIEKEMKKKTLNPRRDLHIWKDSGFIQSTGLLDS